MDEFQFTVIAAHVGALQKNIDNCIRVAGEFFKMECPLASDSMVGCNWYHTH